MIRRTGFLLENVMRNPGFCLLGILLSLVGLAAVPAAAPQHRATHLGNPATRFAPPLATPEDLRALFKDPELRPDIASILRE
jgi:hypothetical protein